jgi:hypothetical protein
VAQCCHLRRYVLPLGVPDDPNLPIGTVPEVNCVAFRAVKFVPDAAGSVAETLHQEQYHWSTVWHLEQ